MEDISVTTGSNNITKEITEDVHDASQDNSSQADPCNLEEDGSSGKHRPSSPLQPFQSIQESQTSCEHQSVQIHEETGMGYVSDHSDIHLSSQPAQTEYSPSDPYFAPATFIRAHSSDLRTDVVGIQEPSSSSPPSSPSMNSNYLPSSSSVPSSSPVEGGHLTPPSSPPAGQSHFINDAPPEVPEAKPLYSSEDYSVFSQPINHQPYDHLQQHDPGPFYIPVPQQHPDPASSSLLPTSFIPAYYPETSGTPLPLEQYARNESVALHFEESQPTEDVPIEQTAATESTDESTKSSRATRKNAAPNPKRPTLAAVRLQHKKLSKPFRSPVVHPPVRLAPKPPTVPSEPLVSSAKSAYLKESSSAKSPSTEASTSQKTLDSKIKHRTTRAASQFKSPLASSSSNPDEAALVKLTPTIQSLERKLQLLRRALKVREEAQEDVLEGLVNKWTEAGREVAQEVWDTVKDSASESEGGGGRGDRKGKKRAIEESWGWDESSGSKKARQDGEERNWGWDVVPVSDRGEKGVEEEGGGNGEEYAASQETNEEVPQPSLGTMLMELGIAPETLGWNEEEGGFVDNEEGRNV
ncbi:hypothetical protein CVT26_001676 [Gymnopilus dilepis]|uniref:Swi5-dependent recombination DNA repair protein 1 homolog n=1 Tax=Gymnopilus dilepis TaxID=231916 RepID=A0A409VRE8_9AGAR|nr:hypothetical protein CVT26_001676 [Gymnopilus dilepis]